MSFVLEVHQNATTLTKNLTFTRQMPELHDTHWEEKKQSCKCSYHQMFIVSNHNELTENKSVLRVHSKQMMILYTTNFSLHEMEVYKRVWLI